MTRAQVASFLARHLAVNTGVGALRPVPAPAGRPSAAFPTIILPEGFEIEKVVGGLTFPTSLTWDDEGEMYVAEAGGGFLPRPVPSRILQVTDGSVQQVVDLAATGVADAVVGLQYYDGHFYVTHRQAPESDFEGAVSRVTRDGQRELLIGGFGDSRAEHQINNIRLGPDGRLHFGVGPANNAAVTGPDVAPFIMLNPELHTTTCRPLVLEGYNYGSPNFLTEEPGDTVRSGAYQPFGVPTSPGQAVPATRLCGGAVHSFDPDDPQGTFRTEADGLRNVIGLAWDETGDMYAAVNGYDVRGVRPVDDEFDPIYRIRPGGWYGYPDFSAATEPVDLPKFDVPDALQAPVFLGDQKLPSPDLRRVIDLEATGLDAPDAGLVAGLTAVNASPSGLDVAPEAFGSSAACAALSFRVACTTTDDDGARLFTAEWGDLTPATNPLRGGPAGYQVSFVDPITGMTVPFVRNAQPGPGSSQGAQPGQAIERPYDVRFGPDGAMYIVDFGQVLVDAARPGPGTPYEFVPGTGVIWRVTATG